MAVVAVVHPGDVGQGVQLLGAQRAVGHGHAQHRRMALHIPAVLQAQGAEVVIGQLAGQVALQLVTELRGTGVHELAVESGVGVHRRGRVNGSL